MSMIAPLAPGDRW